MEDEQRRGNETRVDRHALAAVPPARGPEGADLPEGLRRTVKAFGAALAPPTAVVALAVYFSVRRQEALALHFGIDTSVLDYSTQDYLLRGGDTLFVALLFLLTVGLAVLRVHAAVTRHLNDPRAAAVLGRGALALLAVGLAAFLVGVVAVFRPVPLPLYVRTLSLGVGVGLLGYGAHLRGRLTPRRRPEPAWLSTASVVLVAALIFLSVFWTTKELAQALGRGQAQVLETSLASRPGVVVFSDRRLGLQGPGIVERVLDEADAAYPYRYEGLRLLVRSGGQYFLLPVGWSRGQGNAVVLATQDVRVEFTPGGR